jgi:hypothetical protein
VTEDSPASTLEDAPRIAVLQSAPEAGVMERDTANLADHVAARLKPHYHEVAEEGAMLARAAEGLDLAPSPRIDEDLGRRLALQNLTGVLGEMKTLQFTIPLGTRVIGPPYDTDWSNPPGPGFGAAAYGSFTMAPSGGSASTAIGLYLTVDQPVDAAITPGGTYRYSGIGLENLAAVRSKGGLGMTVYFDSAPDPAYSREVTLWNVAGLPVVVAGGVTLPAGINGNGLIADAASPSSIFVPFPLAPFYVSMRPGHTYLLWVWGWVVTQAPPDFLTFLSVDMPFVKVEAGPPVHIG